MVLRCGLDVIKISRIETAVKQKGSRFLNRIYTSGELEIYERKSKSIVFLAGRWAAKEALFKAFSGFDWSPDVITEFEILQDDTGRPVLNRCSKKDWDFHIADLDLSISHTRDLALAQVVCQLKVDRF